jgi:bZIP transcription factor
LLVDSVRVVLSSFIKTKLGSSQRAKQMTDTSAFEARQHRMERRRRDKRPRSDGDEEVEEDFDQDEDDSYEGQQERDDESFAAGTRKSPLSSIKGIKKQSRYEPVVPMSKEELSEWRKEARRVRNRESAAASRRKTRERIEELEGQVHVIESKYAKALERIAELEKSQTTPAAIPLMGNTTAVAIENQEPPLPARTVSPNISSTTPSLKEVVILPNWSLGSQDAAHTLANSLDFTKAALPLTENHHRYHHHHHNPLMFSRPTAA